MRFATGNQVSITTARKAPKASRSTIFNTNIWSALYISAFGLRTECVPASACPSPATLQHELDAVSQCSYSHMLFDTSVGRGFAVAQQRRDQSQLHGRGHVGAGKVLLCCCDDLFEAVQGRFQIAGLEIGTRIAAALCDFDLILTIMHRGPSRSVRGMMEVEDRPLAGVRAFREPRPLVPARDRVNHCHRYIICTLCRTMGSGAHMSGAMQGAALALKEISFLG